MSAQCNSIDKSSTCTCNTKVRIKVQEESSSESLFWVLQLINFKNQDKPKQYDFAFCTDIGKQTYTKPEETVR